MSNTQKSLLQNIYGLDINGLTERKTDIINNVLYFLFFWLLVAIWYITLMWQWLFFRSLASVCWKSHSVFPLVKFQRMAACSLRVSFLVPNPSVCLTSLNFLVFWFLVHSWSLSYWISLEAASLSLLMTGPATACILLVSSNWGEAESESSKLVKSARKSS